MKKLLICAIMLWGMAACHNKDVDFPDYKYQTVYFAYQYPVRTITFGEDVVNTDLDNQGKCVIMAATGGVYYAKEDVTIGITADNSLLGGGMQFTAGGDDVVAMPVSYYKLAADHIVIPKGTLSGGVEVQLSDAFFNDPKAIKKTYVIPLRMTSKVSADSILAGKDFTLYAVKYINTWHGNYLRRGKDVITGSMSKTVVRHKEYVEYDEVNKLNTLSRTALEFPVVLKNKDGVNVNCTLLLQFDANGNCSITAGAAGFTATGTGKFVKRGEKNSWGSKDRDALYLSYDITLPDMHVTTADTLVMRDRSVAMETYTPVKK